MPNWRRSFRWGPGGSFRARRSVLAACSRKGEAATFNGMFIGFPHQKATSDYERALMRVSVRWRTETKPRNEARLSTWLRVERCSAVKEQLSLVGRERTTSRAGCGSVATNGDAVTITPSLLSARRQKYRVRSLRHLLHPSAPAVPRIDVLENRALDYLADSPCRLGTMPSSQGG
jgi:hypothetical protein